MNNLLLFSNVFDTQGNYRKVLINVNLLFQNWYFSWKRYLCPSTDANDLVLLSRSDLRLTQEAWWYYSRDNSFNGGWFGWTRRRGLEQTLDNYRITTENDYAGYQMNHGISQTHTLVWGSPWTDIWLVKWELCNGFRPPALGGNQCNLCGWHDIQNSFNLILINRCVCVKNSYPTMKSGFWFETAWRSDFASN